LGGLTLTRASFSLYFSVAALSVNTSVLACRADDRNQYLEWQLQVQREQDACGAAAASHAPMQPMPSGS